MLKMYVEPESANEGACLRYVEPKSPNEGPCLRYMLNRNRRSPMRGRVLCVDSKSPNGGPCLTYILNRNCQRRGRVYDIS